MIIMTMVDHDDGRRRGTVTMDDDDYCYLVCADGKADCIAGKRETEDGRVGKRSPAGYGLLDGDNWSTTAGLSVTV